MKLYKYRDLRDPNQGLALTVHIIQSHSFWCARPDSLNDPEEFAWSCNYVLSPYTEDLLTDHVMRSKGRSREQARVLVANAVANGGLRSISEPVVDSMIAQCRNGIGLACFGTSPDNEVLWDRYAGGGCGVCIEVDVPDELLGTQLHPVQYWKRKSLHIDTFLRSTFERQAAEEVYAVSLLSKPLQWAPEAEVRFVSKAQKVNIVIAGSRITRVLVGAAVPRTVRTALSALVSSVPLIQLDTDGTA